MPETIERIENISCQPLEKLIDCLEPRGFSHATSGGTTRSITVRYTGPQSGVWETYRISAPTISVGTAKTGTPTEVDLSPPPHIWVPTICSDASCLIAFRSLRWCQRDGEEYSWHHRRLRKAIK